MGTVTQADWQNILNSALQGNDKAIGRVCEEYLRPKLFGLAVKLMRNRAEAEDIVADVVEKLFKNFHRIGKKVVKELLDVAFGMTRNGCNNYFRTQQRRRQQLEQIQKETFDVDEQHEQRVVRNIAIEELLYTEIRNQLTSQEWDILHLRGVKGLTYQQISDETGIPLATVADTYKRICHNIMHDRQFYDAWKEVEGDDDHAN